MEAGEGGQLPISSRRNSSAQLVEEVEEKGDVNGAGRRVKLEHKSRSLPFHLI